MGLTVFSRSRGNRALLGPAKPGTQSLGDCFCDVSFYRKNVGEFAIICLRPEMRIGGRIDQLDIDPDLIDRLLDTTFKNVGNSKLFPDFGQIARFALVLLR